MRTNHRCGVIPPHLLQHLSTSPDAARAERARNTLVADARHRAARSVVAARLAPPADDEKATPDRAVHDAEGTEELPGKKVRAEGDAKTDDESVNRAYDYLGATYKLFHDVYGRDSLDGKGMPLVGTVHFGTDYVNAFWDGKQMAFGDGDGEVFNDFTLDLTVIAHELTHGVIERTANLEYMDQSGALNESIADVFGALTQQYAEGQTADQADWLIGKALFTKEVEGAALRSFKAPGKAYDDDVLGKDPQPAHMDDYVDTFADMGGVHINSGIPNHAFYRLATDLGGHAWETAGKIWFDTLVSGDLKRTANFKAFAAATHTTAVKLHGDGSAEAAAVKDAWDKVGIAAG